jgi:hypothetical protein
MFADSCAVSGHSCSCVGLHNRRLPMDQNLWEVKGKLLWGRMARFGLFQPYL